MSFIHNIVSAFKYEATEIARNRLYRTSLCALPFVTLLFFGTIFYKGTLDKLPIVVVDSDHSQLSSKLLGMLSATRTIEIATLETSTIEAEELLRRGDVYAMLLIPEGLERNIYALRHSTIECYISGTNLSASGAIESAVQTTLRTFEAGVSVSRLEAMGLKPSDAMREVMPVNIQTHIVSNPYLNYGYYLAPVFMFMALAIFTTLISIYALGRELRYSTARQWLALSGGDIASATIGKLLPTTLMMTLFLHVVMLIIFGVMGMECAGSYTVLTLGGILFIIAYQCVAVFVVSLTSNMRLALSLGGGYAVMAFTFSGITFPRMAMFELARMLSNLFPLTWFSDIFVDQAMRGTEILFTLRPLAYLLSFGVLPVVVRRRLRGIMLIPRYWNRD